MDRYMCPRCGCVSHNPNDIEQKYCGACHRFEETSAEAANSENRVRRLTWRVEPKRVEDQWRCPACRKARWVPARGELVEIGTLTACPRCLAALRFADDRLRSVEDRAINNMLRETPALAFELLKLIEQRSQEQRTPEP